MSTFTFFTRFFVLLIIGHFVIFSAGGQDDADGGVVVPGMVPSLTILVPQDPVENYVGASREEPYCVGASREDPYCVGASRGDPFFMIFPIQKPLPLTLSRTLSGCLRSFEENPEVWSHVFGFFNRVAEQKRVLKFSIDNDKRSLDIFARDTLTSNGFIWGGQIGCQSIDGTEARKNGYQWLPFVFDMVDLVKNNPHYAIQRLRVGIVLAVFASELDALAEKCKVELVGIKKSLATLADAEVYIPRSPQYPPGIHLLDDIG